MGKQLSSSDVSVIPTQLFESLKIDTMQPTEAKLTGGGSQPLAVQGKFEANLQYKARSSKQTVYVVSILSKPLLGKPAIESLNLISRVDIVDKDSCKANYPELFTGLGLMTGEYKIRLKPDSTPYAITTPRRVALLLMPKVKDKLERMQSMEVITKINEPTEWCASIVAVPKPNNKIRICVDLTKLNESVCRERHMLPSVDHTLAQLMVQLFSASWMPIPDQLGRGIKETNDLYNTIWRLLFQSSPLRDYVRTRIFPKKHVSDLRRSRWCGMHDGRHFDLQMHPS